MATVGRRKIWNFFQSIYENQLHGESEKAVQPEWIKTPLLNHQRTGLAAALHLERAKQGIEVAPLPGEEKGGTFFTQYGILGDRVGSGKSLLALSLIKHPPPSTSYSEYIQRPGQFGTNMVGLLRTCDQMDQEHGPQLTDVCLFIIPHALMGQWEDYCQHDANLRTLFLKKRKEIAELNLAEKLPTLDAVFVSSTMWSEFSDTASQYIWNRLFIDEADSIQTNLGMNLIHARFYWLITASWMNLLFPCGSYINMETAHPPPQSMPPHIIQNVSKYRLGDYFNIEGVRNRSIQNIIGNMGISSFNTSILNPAVFQSTRLVIHNTEEYIRTSFDIPEIHHERILCLAPPNVHVLHNMISPEMMERLNAGDADGVLEMLGMQSKSADQIIEAVTDSVQKELEQTMNIYEFKKTLEYSSESAKRKSLEQLEEKIARLRSRIDAIKERLEHTGDQTCPICFCEVAAPAMTPCCRNLFCFGCICQTLKHSSACPLCRTTIPNIQTVQVLKQEGDAGAGSGTITESKKTRTKQEEFRAFLRENPGARVLMFSGYDATFQGLSHVLETDGIPHATLNGSQARITKLIENFAKGKYRVLFLNSHNMGAGLNIRPATHVVLYHRMAIETQNQIIGRAMRMGRTEPLKVIHLLHGNEMSIPSTA